MMDRLLWLGASIVLAISAAIHADRFLAFGGIFCAAVSAILGQMGRIERKFGGRP